MDSITATAWDLSSTFTIRLINQRDITAYHHGKVMPVQCADNLGLYKHAFGENFPKASYPAFMPLIELFNEPSMWIANDSLILEVELQGICSLVCAHSLRPGDYRKDTHINQSVNLYHTNNQQTLAPISV
jgi:hypothetical protein